MGNMGLIDAGKSDEEKMKQELEMMEGLAGSGLINPNDSFDRIFNKELDLEIGKLGISPLRGSSHGSVRAPRELFVLH